MGLARRSLVTPCPFLSFFLSLTLFFRLIPWSIEALCVHLSAQASKTQMGRCSASSLPRETGKALVASVNRTSLLSWGFIGFLCKPGNISLFLSSTPLSFIHSFIRQCCFSFGFPWILWQLDPGREAWRAAVHGVAKSQTRLSD